MLLPTFALIAACGIAAGGCSDPTEQTVQPLHVSEFTSRPTVGVLGKYLGQRLVVQGVKAAHVMSGNGLAVSIVNGRTLAAPVSIELVCRAELREGVRYTLEGFESGGFIGYPRWAEPNASQGFGYMPVFVVTRMIGPATQPSADAPATK